MDQMGDVLRDGALCYLLLSSLVYHRFKHGWPQERTLTSSFFFVGYRLGNMAGSQIFKPKDAPYYIPGVVSCTISFALEFVVSVAWRVVLVLRYRRLNRCN